MSIDHGPAYPYKDSTRICPTILPTDLAIDEVPRPEHNAHVTKAQHGNFRKCVKMRTAHKFLQLQQASLLH